MNPCDCMVNELGTIVYYCREHETDNNLKDLAIKSLRHSNVLKLRHAVVKLFRVCDEDPNPGMCLRIHMLNGGATAAECDVALEMYSEWRDRGMPM